MELMSNFVFCRKYSLTSRDLKSYYTFSNGVENGYDVTEFSVNFLFAEFMAKAIVIN